MDVHADESSCTMPTMDMDTFVIRSFDDADGNEVVALWTLCGLTRPWNDPHRDIARKRSVQRELFLVGTDGGAIVATLMAGYEGHRGWLNYLAVHPARRRRGIAGAMVRSAERRLLALGCPKVNLQVRADNAQALAIWRALGYVDDAAVSLGRRLIPDAPADEALDDRTTRSPR